MDTLKHVMANRVDLYELDLPRFTPEQEGMTEPESMSETVEKKEGFLNGFWRWIGFAEETPAAVTGAGDGDSGESSGEPGDGKPVKRGPGRPLGSRNAPKPGNSETGGSAAGQPGTGPGTNAAPSGQPAQGEAKPA